jgi:hypothetical protein
MTAGDSPSDESAVSGTPGRKTSGIKSLRSSLAVLDLELHPNFIFGYAIYLWSADGKEQRGLLANYTNLAFERPHLLYGMFAVSALQLFQWHPSRRDLYERAAHLHTIVTELAAPHISERQADRS